MTDMPWKSIIKVACLSAIAVPGAMAAVSGLTISPEATAVMTVMSIVAGLTLSEIQPGLSGGLTSLSNADIGRLADALIARQGRPQ